MLEPIDAAQTEAGASTSHVRGKSAQDLPRVRLVRVRFTALEAQRLAPLFTTAVHGALERALRELLCRPGCDDRPDCDHAWLLGPRVGPGGPEGVTDRAPGTLTISPSAACDGEPRLLEPGGETAVDLALVGSRAQGLEPVVLAAMQRAAERGFGAPKHGATSERRAPSRVAGVTELPANDLPAGSSFVLDLRTPLRLKRLGRIAGPEDIDAATLWEALHRRGDVLARLCGSAPLPPLGEAPIQVTDRRLRRVTVPRHSSRQDRWLEWPGVVGTIAVRLAPEAGSDEVQLARQLLAFVARAQLGKATSFGFGKIALMGMTT